MFFVKNKVFFKTNTDVHSFKKRSHYDLHIPAANFAVFQKGVWYYSVKLYNHLPPTLRQVLCDISKFKVALRDFFLQTLFTHWRSIIAGNKGSWFLLLYFNNSINYCIVV